MRIFSFITFLVAYFISISTYGQQWGLYTFHYRGTSAKLTDTTGTTYKAWTLTANTVYSAYILPGDTILQTSLYKAGNVGTGGSTGRIRKISWDGNIQWQYDCSGTTFQAHHDVCAMPNGNVLLIVYEIKTPAECTAKGALSVPTTGIWSEKIIEVKPTGPTSGEIVWEWHLWDHLCQDVNTNIPETYVSSISQHPELMNINYNLSQDWFHMNDLDYNQTLDQIIMSSRSMSEVYVIDHSTTTVEAASHSGGNSNKGGDFLYRWGHPQNYQSTTNGNNSGFNVIHDAHWLPANHPTYPNYMCAYNNNSGGNVQIVIWQPPYNGYNYSYTADQVIGPTTCIKPIIPSFSSIIQGNSQQLLNGNNLISNPLGNIYEVSANGTTLQTILNARSVHASRYTKCYIRKPTARASASSTQICSGTSLTLNSSATSITETNPTYTYAWFSNPSGFFSTTNNPSLNPTTSATYSVIITNTTIGCSDTANISVSVIPVPTANAGDDITISAGQSAILTATGGISYLWSNGAVTDTTTISPILTTAFTVTVTNPNGCTATDQIIVNVPGSVFSTTASASQEIICSGSSATLNATTLPTGISYSYSWSSQPAGFTSTEQNPVVSPTVSTNYTVTVTNGILTDTSSVTITVSPLPSIAGNIIGSANVCQGQSGLLYSVPLIPNTTDYIWTIPPGAIIIDGNFTDSITVDFNNAESGAIIVQGTNACGAGVVSQNFTVNVISSPASAGLITGTDSICPGQTGMQYSVPSIAEATGYSWILPQGATIVSGNNTNSVTVDFSATASSGNISVQGTNFCASGSISENLLITVKSKPEPAENITGQTNVCQNQTNVLYTVPSIENATGYIWTVPAGVSYIPGINTNSILVYFSGSASTENISVYGTNECGNGTASNLAINFNASPTVNCGGTQNIAYGSTTTINANVNGGSGDFNFIWAPAALLDNSSIPNPTTIPLTDSTAFYVTVTDNNSGCIDTAITLIYIYGSQLAVTASATPATICTGNEIQLSCSPTGGAGNNTYTWTSEPAGFSSSEQNPTTVLTETTLFTVSVTSEENTANTSVLITVNQLPEIPLITITNNTLTSSASSGNQWIVDGVSIAGATEINYNVTDPGSYQVEVTDTNGCIAISTTFDYLVGISNSNVHSGISFSPNPTHGPIRIDYNGNFTVLIFNIIGKLIFIGNNTKDIDISYFEGGIYFITVKSENETLLNNKILLLK